MEQLEQLTKAFRAPGARREIECAAPTQLVVDDDQYQKGDAVNNSTKNINTYTVLNKGRVLDRWLDKVVEISGSEPIFFTIIIGLLSWAFLGIRFGHANNWQVGISDAQAIINMIFDAFLMRQQLNSYDSLMFVSASLRSRTSSNKRMLSRLIESGEYERIQPIQFEGLQQTEFVSKLPMENWLGRLSTAVSSFIGHIATVLAF